MFQSQPVRNDHRGLSSGTCSNAKVNKIIKLNLVGILAS